jgi:hypothetical protein
MAAAIFSDISPHVDGVKIAGFDPRHKPKITPSLQDPKFDWCNEAFKKELGRDLTSDERQALTISALGAEVASSIACVKCCGLYVSCCVLVSVCTFKGGKFFYDLEMEERKKIEDEKNISVNRLAYVPTKDEKNSPIDIHNFNIKQLKIIAEVFFKSIYPKDFETTFRPLFKVINMRPAGYSEINKDILNPEIRFLIRQSADIKFNRKNWVENEYKKIEIKNYFDFLNFLNKFHASEDRALFFQKNNNFYAIYKRGDREYWLFDMNVNVIDGLYLQRFENLRLLANYVHSIDRGYDIFEAAFIK